MNTSSTEKQPLDLGLEEQEKEIIKATFKDNDFLLKAIRALFLNLGLNEEEKKAIKNLTPQVKYILRKKLNPQIDKESQIGIMSDPWFGVEQDIKGFPEFAVNQAILSHDRAIKLTERALLLLDNVDSKGLDLSYEPSEPAEVSTGIQLLGRNKFIRNINFHLSSLKVIAQTETKTPKQIAEQARKDSTE